MHVVLSLINYSPASVVDNGPSFGPIHQSTYATQGITEDYAQRARQETGSGGERHLGQALRLRHQISRLCTHEGTLLSDHRPTNHPPSNSHTLYISNQRSNAKNEGTNRNATCATYAMWAVSTAWVEMYRTRVASMRVSSLVIASTIHCADTRSCVTLSDKHVGLTTFDGF
ncbi:hypothetical protein OBBRIDRAFT_796033 [Obba rivulosa]|uniref:Uncharacterized protein n=1 Tax=Obba rivulosa TaxID=1052685 RepID=A0A8E2AY93_9APHY|nr:hypothetical protein OBBRIDRAFT_796033 [Obba rivulosa]